MDIEDVSTEEFSDVSQDREEAGSGKPDSEQNEQIIQIKEKLKKLENDCLPELTKKWKKLENRAASEKKILNAYREFLRQSISAEYQADLNEAHSELEGKREELRAKLLAELEEKKRAVELERSQMDLCGNWIDSFENKTKRRLRPRESKEERNDDHGSSSGHGGLPWLKKQPRTNLSEKPFDKRKRLGPGLNILLSESEINDDLKLIKNASRKRSSSQLASLPSKVSTLSTEAV